MTMKDICDVAKLSRGGVYCHYESTRQIFQEIIDDMTGEQDNEIDLRIERNCSAVTILDELLNKSACLLAFMLFQRSLKI